MAWIKFICRNIHWWRRCLCMQNRNLHSAVGSWIIRTKQRSVTGIIHLPIYSEHKIYGLPLFLKWGGGGRLLGSPYCMPECARIIILYAWMCQDHHTVCVDVSESSYFMRGRQDHHTVCVDVSGSSYWKRGCQDHHTVCVDVSGSSYCKRGCVRIIILYAWMCQDHHTVNVDVSGSAYCRRGCVPVLSVFLLYKQQFQISFVFIMLKTKHASIRAI